MQEVQILFYEQFYSSLNPLNFEKFIQSNWDLAWKFGVCQRTIFRINRQGPQNYKINVFPAYYGPKARHVKGASTQEMVFVMPEKSMIDINELDPTSVQYRLANIEQKLEQVKASLIGPSHVPEPPVFRSAYRPDEALVIFRSLSAAAISGILEM